MLQGLLMISHSGQLLVVNNRFYELFGMPPGSLTPGISYLEMTDLVVEFGNVSAEDMRGVRERRAELIARNERAVAIWELSDGRAFNVTHQPMEEDWLTTFEDVTSRRRAETMMVHLAHHDALTDLPNRVLFRTKLEEAMAFARRGHNLALLCLDLDQFKTVNDTLGHPLGDALLQAVAQRLTDATREIDTVARLGGDEFSIVQTAIEKPAEATGFANRLLELMSIPFEVAGHQIVIGTSIGIALAPQDGLDADQLLRCADMALYRAKQDGRGVYRMFQAEMDAEMQARRLLELDLRQALPAGQLEVFYQPQVDLRAGAMTGVEALLRWRHPQRGLVSPAQFIPLAEEIGLIVPIGEWVLREACRTVASWPGDLRAAVNLSAVQFKSRNLVAVVEQALHDAALAPDRLELEITETVMLNDTDTTVATLNQLRNLGVRIAMDDFGTGYSSLSYLRRFPFDRIKIDQSFVRDMPSKPDCSAIVRAVASLGRELGMATTAEGVETWEQLDLLVSAGCSEIQGYLFSPAVTGDAVADIRVSIADMLQQSAESPMAAA
jgi:diguanylate cyclase (GGDEF)-like protein